MAMLSTMLADDRRRVGWSIEQAARRLRLVRTYREIEAGERWPNWETFIGSAAARLAADVRWEARSVPPQPRGEVRFAHGWSLDDSSSS